MSFWSREKLLNSHPQKLIYPFDEQFAKHGAYELSLGPDVFITTEPNATKRTLGTGEQLLIPPGQFGLLLTEEVVTIPDNAIGFISVRFTLKRQGLVNVSGFHVDPGFSGRLKFAVYNAGSRHIPLARGDRVFMIWFSDLDDRTADTYKGASLGQKEITSDDLRFIIGEVVSPAALKKQFDEIKSEYDRRITVLDNKVNIVITLLITLVVGLVVWLLRTPSEKTPTNLNQPVKVTSPNKSNDNVETPPVTTNKPSTTPESKK